MVDKLVHYDKCESLCGNMSDDECRSVDTQVVTYHKEWEDT